MTAERITVHLDITGAVQGVCYRASMQTEARRLGLDGWVRNRSDGRVEALVQGSPAQVQDITAWCHKGPPQSRVQSVTSTTVDARERCAGFACRDTL
ncbi:MAG: acylphosphatase [Burkholderiaceae bacterium]